MLLPKVLFVVASLVNGGACAEQHFPRATFGYSNATSTAGSDLHTTAPVCCRVGSNEADLILWHTGAPFGVTVATISTVVYQYVNTRITSYSTVSANTTQPLSSSTFSNNDFTFSGIPINLITDSPVYELLTTLVTGTAFTDPYGSVYKSPTPVWYFRDIQFDTQFATKTGSTYVCPTGGYNLDSGTPINIYPSGFYLPDGVDGFPQNFIGDLFVSSVPAALITWVAFNPPPEASSIDYAEYHTALSISGPGFTDCVPGEGQGLGLTYHMPVTSLTATVMTTSTINGNFEEPTQAPVSTPNQDNTGTQQTSAQVSNNNGGSQVGSSSNPRQTTAGVINNNGGSQGVPPASAILQQTSTEVSNKNGGTQGVPSAILQQTSAEQEVSNQNCGSQGGTSASPVQASSPPSNTIAPGIIAGGTTITGNANSVFQIGSSTLTLGGTVIISGSGTELPATYVLPTSASAVIVNSVTQSFISSANAAAATHILAPVFTAGGSTITGNANTGFVISSSTLTPGGTVVISGSGTELPTTYILPTTGSAVILNGATQSFISSAGLAAATVAPIFTAGGSTITSNANSGFVIGSSTLTPGGTVIISSSGTASPTTYVLPATGSAIIVNGITQTISSKTLATTPATLPIIVIGSETYTENSASEFIIDSQTLTSGAVVTASGETVSLAGGGESVVTVSGTSSSAESLGGIIASMGGYGGGAGSGSASQTSAGHTASVTASKSKAGAAKSLDLFLMGSMAVLSGLVVLLL